MPFEVGGRSDKLGNRYESRWIVKQLLRLLSEEIAAVTIEAIGDEEEGIDLWIKKADGSKECHQCKARNASKEFWDVSDLAARGIFKKAKKQLEANCNVVYCLISAVAGMMIHDLTIRARNSNNNSEEFYKYQIENSGKEVRKAFRDFVECFGLDINSLQGRNKAYEYLKRIYVIQYPDDINEKDNLIQVIKYLYIGDPRMIYNLVSNYVVDNDLLGTEITAYMLDNFLVKHNGIFRRSLNNDERIIPRIDILNNEFSSSFIPINRIIIHRFETDDCYNAIYSETSIILHGKAGSGKSGCVLELLSKLRKENIVHLALKLDRRIPQNTSESYGLSIGLPASPIYCLDAVSKDNEAVLILDQLDAIRWTNNHSGTALEVCKEMIREAHNLNKIRNRKIVIVFVCRTFDFENDHGIKLLFSNNEDRKEQLSWKDIKVSELDDKNVQNIVGTAYNNLSKKLQTLLRIPSNLYIWSNLDENRRSNTYITSSDLIRQWWEQLRHNSEMIGISNIQINKLKDAIVTNINKTGKLMVPIFLINNYSKSATDFLLSSGLLISDGKSIGFVHQSFFDYFLVENMLSLIYDGHSIIEVVGDKAKQTPTQRYQLQMLFENLLDYNIDKFAEIGTELIISEKIRFYMKYVFLEVLGQANTICHSIKNFLKNYLIDIYWKKHLVDVVFLNHPIFVSYLISEGYIYDWLKFEQNRDIALLLLRSVSTALPDEIASLLKLFAFKDDEMDNKIYNTLCWNIEDDSDQMFEFRLELIKRRPQQLNLLFHWEAILNKKPLRAILIFELIIKNYEFLNRNNINRLDQKSIEKFIQFAKGQSLLIWNKFMPYLSEATSNLTNIYDIQLKFWKKEQYMDQLYGRVCVKMIKAAAEIQIQEDPQSFLEILELYYDNNSLIVNEILLFIMYTLPSNYSDYVFNWLLKRYDRLFDYTGENDDYLDSVKKLIQKHSKTCSDKMFNKLEQEIYYFHEKDELSHARHRFNYNKEIKESGGKQIVYWPYWGRIQNNLLPMLDNNRISKNANALISVLKRRFNYLEITFQRSKVTGGFVESTIGSIADRISNKQWLRIIENKKERNHWAEKRYRTEGAIKESSPEQFSRDLERIGEKNPNRVAKLALKFSSEVDNYYVRAIYNTIREKTVKKELVGIDNWTPVGLDLAQKILLKFRDRDESNVAISLCRAIANRSDENWSDDILKIVSSIAQNHSDPEKGKMNVWSSEDEEEKTINSLFTNSMNCVRGCAAEAIAALLWEKKDRYEKLKNAVNAVVNDDHLAVNMAAIECICPITNIDKEMAQRWFFDLAKKDIRIVAHPYAYNLFYYFYENDPESIIALVEQMYQSSFEDVSETGARHMANMYLIYGEFDNLNNKDINRTKAQKKGTLELAISLLDHQNFHDKCKEIIEMFLDDGEDFSDSFVRILHKSTVNVNEDLDFIVKIIKSRTNRSMMHYFIDFINENDPPIEGLKDIVFGMCENVVKNAANGENLNVGSELYWIVPELANVVASLYDRTQDDVEINQKCLDMWDMMFENRIGTIRELSQSIMNY